jgi:cytochrome c biogenesis protein CcmG, thiol:disulfide interchange protein DsbE
MQRRLIWIAVIAGLAVVAISLGMRSQPDGSAIGEAKRISLYPEKGPGAGAGARAAPASRLVTGEDLDARLRALRGHPVVLNAWASWCPPCREELPLLAAAAARYGRRATFLGADVEDDAGSARRLLAEIPLGYPSYGTSFDSLGPLDPATGAPFTLFIDREGEVVGRHIGAYRSQDELDAEISRFLAEEYPSDETAAQ